METKEKLKKEALKRMVGYLPQCVRDVYCGTLDTMDEEAIYISRIQEWLHDRGLPEMVELNDGDFYTIRLRCARMTSLTSTEALFTLIGMGMLVEFLEQRNKEDENGTSEQ